MGNFCDVCMVPQIQDNNQVQANSVTGTRPTHNNTHAQVNGQHRATNTSSVPRIETITRDRGSNVKKSKPRKLTGLITPLQKQQLDEEKYLASKYLDQGVAREKSENLVFKEEGAGELCEICNSHAKTHFAVPCGHSACLTCWSRWLYSKPIANINSTVEPKRNENCFVCHQKVNKIKRYSFSVVPLKRYENKLMNFTSTELSEFADDTGNASNFNLDLTTARKNVTLSELEVVIDDSLERVVRTLVDINDDLDNKVVKKLEEVELHLFGLLQPESETSLSAFASILAVECVVANELFREYRDIFRKERDGVSHSKWAALVLEVDKLQSAVKRAESVVTQMEAGEGMNTDINPDVNELKALMSTLSICVSPTAIRVQWSHVKELLYKASPEYHLIPAILKVFGETPSSSTLGLDQALAGEALDLAYTKRDKLDKKFNKLLDESIPVLISKISHFVDKVLEEEKFLASDSQKE